MRNTHPSESSRNRPSCWIGLGDRILLFALFLLWFPNPAWAVQVHGQSEGWIVHQMAHLLFCAALVFLLTVLHRRPPGISRPWKQMKLSLLLFLLWNIDTTTVHWLARRLPEGAVDQCASLADSHLHLPDTGLWMFYYLGSLDHLLCVPAIVLLFLSLRGFAAETNQRVHIQERPTP